MCRKYSICLQVNCNTYRLPSEETFYQSYFAAIEDELAAFDPNKHVITTVDDLLEVLDLVRKNFTQPKNKITESVTAFANPHGSASDGLKKKVCTKSHLIVANTKLWVGRGISGICS